METPKAAVGQIKIEVILPAIGVWCIPNSGEYDTLQEAVDAIDGDLQELFKITLYGEYKIHIMGTLRVLRGEEAEP